MHNYETSGCPSLASMTEPVLEYSHSVGCSVTGGYVYRGSAIPWLRGSYFYGDYCSGDIWTTTVNPANNTATSPVSRTNDLNSGNLNISSFGQDAAGEVYVVHHGGTVYRIDPE